MSKPVLAAALAAASILCAGTSPVDAAPIISVGPYTVSTTNPFLVPIIISDAEQLIAWSFGLAYDPADLQINDPASLDLFGRPVTEGEFFAAGAPFNVLVPGVIVLDSNTFLQTGTLFGVEGSYGGFDPAPSGNGVLAYIEFVTTATGNGTSTIRVTAPSTTTAVPEPSAVLLLASALGACASRRLFTRHRAIH